MTFIQFDKNKAKPGVDYRHLLQMQPVPSCCFLALFLPGFVFPPYMLASDLFCSLIDTSMLALRENDEMFLLFFLPDVGSLSHNFA